MGVALAPVGRRRTGIDAALNWELWLLLPFLVGATVFERSVRSAVVSAHILERAYGLLGTDCPEVKPWVHSY